MKHIINASPLLKEFSLKDGFPVVIRVRNFNEPAAKIFTEQILLRVFLLALDVKKMNVIMKIIILHQSSVLIFYHLKKSWKKLLEMKFKQQSYLKMI